MRIAVYGDSLQLSAWQSKQLTDGHEVILCNDTATFQHKAANVYFQFSGNELLVQPATGIAVFMHAVTTTTASLPAGIIRFNGWPVFFEKEIIEIAADPKYIAIASDILGQLGLKYTIAPDEPGFIAPRIISMIINEAYFALADQVSERTQIDTAMKLGTAYPYGPFEWAALIGLENIVQLLETLAETDPRYTPCKAMTDELNNS